MILLDALTEIGYLEFKDTSELHNYVWETIERFSKTSSTWLSHVAGSALRQKLESDRLRDMTDMREPVFDDNRLEDPIDEVEKAARNKDLGEKLFAPSVPVEEAGRPRALAQAIADDGDFSLWQTLSALDRRHGTYEAVDAIRELIAERAPAVTCDSCSPDEDVATASEEFRSGWAQGAAKERRMMRRLHEDQKAREGATPARELVAETVRGASKGMLTRPDALDVADAVIELFASPSEEATVVEEGIYDALREAEAARPVEDQTAEAVAWRIREWRPEDKPYVTDLRSDYDDAVECGWSVEPLYLHPAPVGDQAITDELVDDLINGTVGWIGGGPGHTVESERRANVRAILESHDFGVAAAPSRQTEDVLDEGRP